jgi:D-proline reductase (dithiol) PrdB
MAEMTPLEIRAFMRVYPWRRIDPVPWTPLPKPLSECRVALVSSAAQVLPGQAPFDPEAKGGDCSFREIPGDSTCELFTDTHPSTHFDHSGLAADLNVAFPLDRVRELAASGRIGSVAPRHLSFCGAITAPGRLRKETAPAAAQMLVEDGVDVALLFPV